MKNHKLVRKTKKQNIRYNVMDFSIPLYHTFKKKGMILMKEYKTGAISVRVSTDMQTKYSPDSQIKMCLDYAKVHDIYVPSEYIYRDDAISGQHADKRTEFQRMVSDAKKKPKPFDCILIYDFSRFARNKEESVMYKAMLRKKCGIDVISITQPLGEGKERVILESMYEAMDEYYVLNLSENVQRGKKEKASRGEHQGATPYGYFYDKNIKELKIDPDASNNVKYIFNEWIKPDTTINGLTKKINEMGIKTSRGKRWCEESLKVVLNNPIYIGYIRYTTGGMGRNYNHPDMQIIKGIHESIINDDTWKEAQEKLKKHNMMWFKYKKPAIKHDYWLRGLLKCSNCGKNLIMIERQSGTKKKPFYQCNGYNKNSCNESHSILKEKLESALLSELQKIYKSKLDINIVKTPKQTTEINLIHNSISKMESRLERIKIAYMDGIDSLEEYKLKKNKILEELDKLKLELEKASSDKYTEDKKNKVYNLCEEACSILSNDEIDFKIKEQLANELFEQIIYNKKENTLYVTFKEQ